MMELRQNLMAPCAAVDPNDQRVDVDLTGLIRRLLLFDTYILQSARLREFPAIVAGLGYEQVLELLSSKVLKIHCDAVTIGQTGQLEVLEGRRKKGLLPLGSYSFGAVRIPDAQDHAQSLSAAAEMNRASTTIRNREQYIHGCLKELHTIPSLSLKQVIKLKQRVVDTLVPPPPNRGEDSVRQLHEDLRAQSPIIGRMVQKSLKEQHDISVPLAQLAIRVWPLDETDFRVETNIADFGLDTLAIHKVVERALLGLGGLNQRIEEMKTYNALSGCIDAECPLFMHKLGFLLERCRPGAQEENFQRVLEIRGLPEFLPEVDKINISKLLAVRDSAEIREFRNWLSSVDSATDKEVHDRVGSLVARLGNAVQSKPGRAARFVVTTGLGLVGPVTGVIAGVLDTFVVDKILPKSGVWTFVNKLYPSIFDSRN